MIGTVIMIEIETGRGTAIANVNGIMKGHESGMVEVVGMEERGQSGGPGMEERAAGIGTVTGVGHGPLLDMVTGDHLKVQLTNIKWIGR